MLRLINQINPFFFLIFSLIVIVFSRLFYLEIEIDFQNWQIEAAPLAAFVFNLLGENIIKISWLNLTLSGVLVFFNAIYINHVIVKHRILPENNFLLAWVYILFAHIFPEWIILSPQLIVTTLYIFMFSNIYELKSEKKIIGRVFNIGLVYALSILFWYPSLWLLPFLIAGFYTYSVLSLRFVLAFLVAVFIPFYYILFILFIKGYGFFEKFKSLFSTFQFNQFDISIDLKFLVLTVIFTVITIITILSVISYKKSAIKEIRQFFNFVYLLLFVLMVGLLFQNINFKLVLLPLVLPLSIFTAVLLNTFKRKFVSEIFHIALILLNIISYFNF